MTYISLILADRKVFSFVICDSSIVPRLPSAKFSCTYAYFAETINRDCSKDTSHPLHDFILLVNLAVTTCLKEHERTDIATLSCQLPSGRSTRDREGEKLMGRRRAGGGGGRGTHWGHEYVLCNVCDYDFH